MPFDGVPLEEDASVLLRRATKYLRRGWCQGMAMSDDGGSVCAIGGLALAAGKGVLPGDGSVNSSKLGKEAMRRLNMIARMLGFVGIMDMNDKRGMTKERIIAVFEQASGDTVEF